MKTILAILSLAVFLTACGHRTSEPAAVETSVYADAVTNAARPDSDRDRDSGRKPAEVMEFFGIEPGMTVLDLFSGGGYYAELLSYVVGENGHVTAQSNQAYLGFVGDEFKARHADGRLPNVDVLMAENNELELEAGAFDAIMMSLSYHDLYYAAPDRGWPKIDGPKLLAELYKGLRPGGLLCIIDHYAEAGAPRETGNTLHRIDKGIVTDEVSAAGFVPDGETDLLHNMDDDRGKIVFDPEIRGKTDRFVLRYRKPE